MNARITVLLAALLLAIPHAGNAAVLASAEFMAEVGSLKVIVIDDVGDRRFFNADGVEKSDGISF